MESGATLGQFEIVEPLGAGGMGEVYRARDTNLKREVAIKLLPGAMSRDPERLARLQREAQLLAALNHPRIASIYSLEQSGDLSFLVLELVEGETLAEHLARGPLPVDVALETGRQIAEALEAAHDKGIIHRDLKPANVKLTPDNEVKVLDFGLAKGFEAEAPAGDLSHSASPTAMQGSQTGVIMGTVAYMSPEQARGQALDLRTDIFSFGSLLYEMLSGRRPFAGETASDVMASILRAEPDWSAVPATTPLVARLLLRRCLRKDPRDRLQAIGDARVEIAEALEEGVGELSAGAASAAASSVSRRAVSWGTAAAVAVVAALAGGVAAWQLARPMPPPGRVMRTLIDLSPAAQLHTDGRPFAISPDGSRLVFSGLGPEGSQLFLHAMERFGATPIAGTEGASSPFFSPDSRWVGFFAADGHLKKVSLDGGAPLTICEAPTESYGASWGSDDTIVYAPAQADLMRVPASGGNPQVAAVPDRANGELAYYWPQFLPGSDAVLVTVWGAGGIDSASVAVLSLPTGERQILLDAATGARYASTGHLVYADAAGLVAVPFDVGRLEMVGTPVPVIDDVRVAGDFGAAYFSFSDRGELVYLGGGETTGSLVWVDRDGVTTPLGGEHRVYEAPRLSPDGRQVLLWIQERDGNADSWVFDLERRTLTLVTFDGDNPLPVWVDGGRHIVFASDRHGSYDLIRTLADGSGAAQDLLRRDHGQFPTSGSADGRFLAFYEVNPVTHRDIWTMSLDGDPAPTPFLATPASERAAMFSPDGRWIAYVSDESGRDEVYVRPFPGPGSKQQISLDGGAEAVWARSGSELFYRQDDRMMAVAVQTGPELRAGTPEMLFEKPFGRSTRAFGYPRYDVDLEGRRFLMIELDQDADSSQLRLVLDWFAELESLAPPSR